MARNHAHLTTAGISDPEWTALSPGAQWLYVLLLRQPRLSLCGHLDVLPERWAAASHDVTAELVRTWMAELTETRYLLHDATTGEVLIRTFTRHDLDPNRLSLPVVKGFWSAWSGMLSASLQAFVVANLPDEAWSKLADAAPPEAVEMRRSAPKEWEPPSPPERGGPSPFESPSSFLLSPSSASAPDNSPQTTSNADQPEPLPVDVEQQVRRAIGIYARTLAARNPGVDDLGSYAHGIGKNLDPDDRALLAEWITGGATAEDAAARLADPLRDLGPTGRPGIDPAAVAAADELAKRREQSTAERLAEQRAVKPSAPPTDLRAGLTGRAAGGEGGTT